MSLSNLTGKQMNELWQVGAKHALYSKDGKWYHQLKTFPGALFDPGGYIVFNSSEEYINCTYLVITKDLHVKEPGISAISGYVKVSEKSQLQLLCKQIKHIKDQKGVYNTQGEHTEAFDLLEAERIIFQTSRIIRDTELSQRVKFIHENRCQICGETLDLGNGKFYSESHHIQPLGGKHRGPDIIENILCVCPNHHALLDYGAIEIIKSELRLVSGHEPSDIYIEYHNSKIHKSRQ